MARQRRVALIHMPMPTQYVIILLDEHHRVLHKRGVDLDLCSDGTVQNVTEVHFPPLRRDAVLFARITTADGLHTIAQEQVYRPALKLGESIFFGVGQIRIGIGCRKIPQRAGAGYQ